MADSRLKYEIKRYVKRYENELRQSGMSEEKISETLEIIAKEAYLTVATGKLNTQSAIKRYQFFNDLYELSEKDSNKVAMIKR